MVNPAIVEYLNPKSLIRSSILEVSVIWNLLNTSAIILAIFFFLNGCTSSRANKASYVFSGLEKSKKYLLGVAIQRFSSVGSFKYGNSSGKMLLKIILPKVVNKYLPCPLLFANFSADK